jgi:hypothetical protein
MSNNQNEEKNEEENEEEKEEKYSILCPYDIILNFYDQNIPFGHPLLFGKVTPLFGSTLLIKHILRKQKKNTQPIPLIETRDIIDNYLSTKSSQNPEEEWEIINESNSE